MYNKSLIEKYVKNGYTYEQACREIDYFTEIMFGYTYKDFLLGKVLDPKELNKLEKAVSERTETSKPVQQIAGQSFFCGRKFFVNEHTLIPRPETEMLVEKTLEKIKELKHPAKVLDLCTGSGCIGISLALFNPNIKIVCSDISREALTVAKKNAEYHGVSAAVEFIESDLFGAINGKFDVIVSNPPYIPLSEKDLLEKTVKDFDPALALFTNDDKGLEFYLKIIPAARQYLPQGGFILFESGMNQSNAIKKILTDEHFYDIEIVKDLNNTDRIITAKK